MTSELFQAIHDLHEAWLSGPRKNRGGAPVLVVDADQDLELDPGIYSRHEDEIVKKWNGQNPEIGKKKMTGRQSQKPRSSFDLMEVKKLTIQNKA